MEAKLSDLRIPKKLHTNYEAANEIRVSTAVRSKGETSLEDRVAEMGILVKNFSFW